MSVGVRAEALPAASGDASGWAAMPLVVRARVLARGATRLAADAEALAAQLRGADGQREGEVWSAEIPTLEAPRWHARDAARALRPRRLGRARLPWYFRGSRHKQRWAPRGWLA